MHIYAEKSNKVFVAKLTASDPSYDKRKMEFNTENVKNDVYL